MRRQADALFHQNEADEPVKTTSDITRGFVNAR
jgi:hypothetical protein